MPYLVHTPGWLQSLYPKRLWRQPEQDTVYLSFDDGPIPEVTPWVLETLAQHQAKATFFVIGDNVRKNPEVLEQVAAAGHSIGNHTFHHLNGWKTSTAAYLENVAEVSQLLDSQLFRPPYGRLSTQQATALEKLGYQIIMWDVLSADFDAIAPQKCLANVLENISQGSIVVFHDSIKASENLRFALPKTLEFIKSQGMNCAGLP